MRTIPEVREELEQILRICEMPMLARVVVEAAIRDLKRRPPVRKAKPKSAHAGPALRAAIRGFAKKHPGLSQLEIARRFNVNPGRVSEAIRGKRK